VAFATLALLAAPAAAAEVETVPFETRASDGVALRGHVFLPKQASRPLATVLHYSPYFGGSGYTFANTEQWATDSEIAFLLDAGFAVAAVSVRGTGRSEGCLRFGDRTDWQDVSTVIEALAALPWSNGRVGMYGHSYPAWTQMMAAGARPPALKAIVPTSGVTDLWTLLTRRGAPLNTAGSTFVPFVVGVTRSVSVDAVRQLLCPEILTAVRDQLDVPISGDRTQFFRDRDLKEPLTGSPVPMMTSIGIVAGDQDGHILQLEDMWDRLRPDRTRFVLGQWAHETPTEHKPGWHDQVVGWFDHYLRDGPQTVEPGVVEYQDDVGTWHTADRWPPSSTTRTQAISRGNFLSLDIDPGLRLGGSDQFGRLFASACGPHQVLSVSEPVEEDMLLAGNFEAEVTLTNTLPGGNFSLFLWRSTKGTCPDASASWFGRALMDLRHYATPGESRSFPTGRPTTFSLRSQPMAARLHRGERIVAAIGGGSLELEPDPLHPLVTVNGGTVRLPVISSGG
jgi:pimeloyl-ACP methyl ester carboxylesterase